MIAVDASAALVALLRTKAAGAVEIRLFAPGEAPHAPHLIDLELAQVLRRFAAAGEMALERGRLALADFPDLAIHRYPHSIALARIRALRGGLTAHDAAHVALAEALDAPLVTRDRKLAAAGGHDARVELV